MTVKECGCARRFNGTVCLNPVKVKKLEFKDFSPSEMSKESMFVLS